MNRDDSASIDPTALVVAATEVIGDGCVAWRLQSGDALSAEAVSHRDPELERSLGLLLTDPPLEPWEGGWIRHALQTRCPVWLDRLAGEETLFDCGLPADANTSEVVVQSISPTQALVAYRDRLSAPFTDRARRALERLIADSQPTQLASAIRINATAKHQSALGPSLEQTSALIWQTDAHGAIVYANSALCHLVGLPRTRLIGLPADELLADRPIRPRLDYFGHEPIECRLASTDGSETWIEVVSKPCYGDHGLPDGAIHTGFDIDHRRRSAVAGRAKRDSAAALACLAETLFNPSPGRSFEQVVVELSAEQLGPGLVAILAISRDLTEFTTEAQAGPLGDRVRHLLHTRYPLPVRSAMRAAIEGERPVRVTSFDHDPTVQRGPLAMAIGAQSALCAPAADGRLVLAVFRPEPGPISDEEAGFLEGAARLLTLARSARANPAASAVA